MHSMALRLANCAIGLLQNDIKQLVIKEVYGPLKKLQMDPDPTLSERGEQRLKNLSLWLKHSVPLAYPSAINKHKGGITLLYSILTTEPTPLVKLPEHSSSPMTIQSLSNSLWALLISPTASTIIRPPIIRTGMFNMAIREVVKLVQSSPEEISEPQEFFYKIIREALRTYQIQALPWSRVNTSNKSHHNKVTTETWINLSVNWIAQGSSQSGSSQLAQSLSNEARYSRRVIEASSANPTTPWSIPSRLGDMGVLWRKHCLPDDFQQNGLNGKLSGTNLELLTQTYEFVEENFDAKKDIHRLGLYLGILFSFAIPYVDYSEDPNELALDRSDANDEDRVTTAIRNMEWRTVGPNRKGFTAPGPFVRMVTTAVIAFLDTGSPLSEQLDNNGVQGSAWTSKHGKTIQFIEINN